MHRSVVLYGLCWLLSWGAALAQQAAGADSLRRLLTQPQTPEQRLQTLMHATTAIGRTHPQEALEWAEQAVTYARDLGEHALLAKALNELGVARVKLGRYAAAQQALNEALKINQTLLAGAEVATTYANLADIYFLQGRPYEALKHDLEAIRLNKRWENQRALARNYDDVGVIYLELRKFDEALDYAKEALRLAESLHDSLLMGYVVNNLGHIYNERDDQATALEYFLRARGLADRLGDMRLSAVTHANLCDAYHDHDDPQASIPHCAEAIRINLALGDRYALSHSHRYMGANYLRMNRTQEGFAHLKTALALADTIGAQTEVNKLYSLLGEEYARRGQYEQAYHFAALNKALTDTLLDAENRRRLDQLQAELVEERLRRPLDTVGWRRNLDAYRLLIALLSVALLVGGGLAAYFWLNARRKRRSIRFLGEHNRNIQRQNRALALAQDAAQRHATYGAQLMAYAAQHTHTAIGDLETALAALPGAASVLTRALDACHAADRQAARLADFVWLMRTPPAGPDDCLVLSEWLAATVTGGVATHLAALPYPEVRTHEAALRRLLERLLQAARDLNPDVTPILHVRQRPLSLQLVQVEFSVETPAGLLTQADADFLYDPFLDEGRTGVLTPDFWLARLFAEALDGHLHLTVQDGQLFGNVLLPVQPMIREARAAKTKA